MSGVEGLKFRACGSGVFGFKAQGVGLYGIGVYFEAFQAPEEKGILQDVDQSVCLDSGTSIRNPCDISRNSSCRRSRIHESYHHFLDDRWAGRIGRVCYMMGALLERTKKIPCHGQLA